jgi:opacity protein-like surface antigen
MKKIAIITCLINLSLLTTLKAQDSVTVAAAKPSFHRVEFGFRFMPTVSAFEMQTSSGGTVKGEGTLGYGVGAMLGFNFNRHVGMQAEVIYNSLSQKYRDEDLEREIHVNYINIPLMISFNTGKSKPVNLNLVAGPQLGYNVGSKITTSGGQSSDTLVTVLATKRSDFGFAYGAGLEFALNTTRTIRLDLGYRGVYGFANISNTSQTTATNSYYILDRAKVRTNSAYVGFTFLF